MKKILSIGAAAAALALPGISYAADYAYVDQAGNVQTVTADNAMAAMTAAVNIDENSGVMLIDSPTDQEVVDETVSGV